MQNVNVRQSLIPLAFWPELGIDFYGHLLLSHISPPRAKLFNDLQVQSDADTINEDDALIEQLLIRDFSVNELLHRRPGADKLDCFGTLSRAGGQSTNHREIVQLEFHIRGNSPGEIFQKRSEKEVETLRGPLVNRTLRAVELEGVFERHLQREFVLEDHKGRGRIGHEM